MIEKWPGTPGKILKNLSGGTLAAISIAVLGLPLFFFFKDQPFFSDDYTLLHFALKQPLPIFGDWLGLDGVFFRPLSIAALYIQLSITGYNPFWFYVCNLFLHILNAFLMYLVCRKILEELGVANRRFLLYGAVMMFFVAYQSMLNVLWISGRTDLLCAFFGLAALYYFLQPAGWISLVAGCICIVLSLAAKETGLLYIYYAFLLALFAERKEVRQTGRRKKLILIALAAIVLLYVGYRSILFGARYNLSHISVFHLKFWIAGAASLIIPIDKTDLLLRAHGHRIILYAAAGLLILYAILIVKALRMASPSIKRIIIALWVISFSTILIYAAGYPASRLAYSQLLPVALAVVLLISSLQKIGKTIFVACLIAMNCVGLYSLAEISTQQSLYINAIQRTVLAESHPKNEIWIPLPEQGRLAGTVTTFHLPIAEAIWRGRPEDVRENEWYAPVVVNTRAGIPDFCPASVTVAKDSTILLTVTDNLSGLAGDPLGNSLQYRRWLPMRDSIGFIYFDMPLDAKETDAAIVKLQFNKQYIISGRLRFLIPDRTKILLYTYDELIKRFSTEGR